MPILYLAPPNISVLSHPDLYPGLHVGQKTIHANMKCIWCFETIFFIFSSPKRPSRLQFSCLTCTISPAVSGNYRVELLKTPGLLLKSALSSTHHLLSVHYLWESRMTLLSSACQIVTSVQLRSHCMTFGAIGKAWKMAFHLMVWVFDIQEIPTLHAKIVWLFTF